jgi:uncharacterized membrane protein YeaQ/YmgE (transglycosylase-associated protein family)
VTGLLFHGRTETPSSRSICAIDGVLDDAATHRHYRIGNGPGLCLDVRLRIVWDCEERSRRQTGEDSVGIISSMVVGLIAGFIGSKIVNKSGSGLIRDIILGIVAAFVGGWIFTAMSAAGVTGVNIYSIFVALIGAVVLLVPYHAIFGQRARA